MFIRFAICLHEYESQATSLSGKDVFRSIITRAIHLDYGTIKKISSLVGFMGQKNSIFSTKNPVFLPKI